MESYIINQSCQENFREFSIVLIRNPSKFVGDKLWKMAATLAAVKGATEVLLGTGDLSIDNWTFKLYYQW